ncbi:alanine/glycine:cation symporter family protein [Thorsellia kenyensis]|uniref:Alanine/glycine:cation symporter family protein n=1 Tax=Thorsellia kenyensis TaxID=1549888 RepID=A0ABV6C8N9_9GAMM
MEVAKGNIFVRGLESIQGLVWSYPLIGLCLFAGLFFSIATRFIQVRGVKEMIRLMLNNKSSASGVSSFQAFAMSLSGRVGTGNIAGVALAIGVGGPGAIFWMWVVAFLGASTSFVECTLAQIYKQKDNKAEYRGGPAYYIEKAMGKKWYALLFAGFTVLAWGFLLPTNQSNAIAESLTVAWEIPPLYTAIGISIVMAFVIFGGLKRIASFAQWVVPFMAIAYVLVAIIIIVINFKAVPGMIKMIFEGAFGLGPVFGAVIWQAIQMGVKRGLYSNEAGQGSAPHSAAVAEVQHPAEQGYVQAFSVYIDTLFVCTATAFIMLSTGLYNIVDPNDPDAFIYAGLVGVDAGPAFVQHSIESIMPGFGKGFVAIALLFFAFTTIIAYYYMAETNLTYLFSNKPGLLVINYLRLGSIITVFLGCIYASKTAWHLGDIGVGLMAWMNIIALLILFRPAIKALRDYETQKKAGKTPIFQPTKLGIKNADLWDEINREK